LADEQDNWPGHLPRPRPVQDSDWPAITSALLRSRDRLVAMGREWAHLLGTSPQAVLCRLLDETEVVIIGDYLVAAQEVGSWWLPDARFMQEVLLLRISDATGNRLRSVVRIMEHCARQAGCAGLLVGTYGDGTGSLAKAYRRLGFRDAPAQLYKEL